MSLRSWSSRLLLLAVTAALHPTALQAQQPGQPSATWPSRVRPPNHPVSRPGEKIAAAQKYMRDVMVLDRIPGMSAAVAIDGMIVWAEGFGYADLEDSVTMKAFTRMRIASISKALTSAAVGQLIEQGKLNLDAPVQRYVPGFPRKQWPITTRQVAGHLAGIRHYRQGEFESMRPYSSVTAGLAIFQNDSLLAPPGSSYHYSTYGWNLVSAVVERAAAQEFTSYMKHRVFLPLGMRHTSAEFVDSIIPKRASYYSRDSAGPVSNARYVDNSYKWAGGGFLSTPGDLVTFGAAMLNGRLLKDSTIDELWRSQKTTDGKPTGYGIGWSTSVDSGGRHVIYHSGEGMGANSMLLIYPEENVVVAVLANTNTRYASRGAREIARIFLEK